MLNKNIFIRGIQLINAIVPEQNGIQETSTLDTYYLLLQDLNDDIYLKSIATLLKTKTNMYYPPSPGEIIKFYSEEEGKSLSIDSILNHISRDIVIFGPLKQPDYKKEIKEAIELLGGWTHLCRNEHAIRSKESKNLFKSKLIKTEKLLS